MLLFLGAGAVLVLLPLSLPYGLRGWLAGAVAVSLAQQCCLHALGCSGRSVCRIKLDSSGAGAIAHHPLLPWRDCRVIGWYVHPWLVILRLEMADTGRRRDVLVAWDALPENLFRELRVLVNGLRRTAEGLKTRL